MSSFRQIDALLNPAGGDDDAAANPDVPGTKGAERPDPSTDRRNAFQTQQEPEVPSQTVQQTAGVRHHAARPFTAIVSEATDMPSQSAPHQVTSSSINNNNRGGFPSQHVVREQPVYTIYDCRYWPYQEQQQPSVPSSNALLLPRHNSCKPAFRTHAAEPTHQQQQHSSFLLPPLPQDNDNASSTLWIRPRRSRACQNCRARKMKCTGSEPTCDSCAEQGAECRWPQMKKRGPKPKPKHNPGPRTPETEQEAEPPFVWATPAGMAVEESAKEPISTTAVAASQNHPLNADSRGDEEEGKDEYTTTAMLQQPPPPLQAGLAAHHLLPSSGQSDQHEILRRFYSDEVAPETRESVIYYLDYFYGICPIFHPASFVRRVVEGRVDSLLLDAMRASAARIITKRTGKRIDHEALLTRTYTNLLLHHKSTPTVDYIRALILLSSLNGGEENFRMYNVLSCLAVSLITRLGWNLLDYGGARHSAPATWKEWIALEVKRRAFWIIYVNDSYQSFLGNRRLSLSKLYVHVAAPATDFTWEDVTVFPNAGSDGRSSRSVLPVQTNLYERNSRIIRNASLVHSLQTLCDVSTINNQIGAFMLDFKQSMEQQQHQHQQHQQAADYRAIDIPAAMASLFECAEFAELHGNLVSWKKNLIRAEDLKPQWAPSYPFTEFGSYKHRLHVMRIRYFCMAGYYVTLIVFLHMCNRPSFFAPRPPATTTTATNNNSSNNNSNASLPSASSAPANTTASAPSAEDTALRELLGAAFPPEIHEGLVAYDVVADSWDICVAAVLEYVAFLDKNADVPLDRYDQIMPLCLFLSMTVLIRQIRMWRTQIADAEAGAKAAASGLKGVRERFIDGIRALRRLWSLLLDLGAVWKTEGMECLLRSMQVEETSSTAELLAELAL
ncbi:hypothetical protein LPJ72_005858 [Coemansia sp. Benny D160-2]|nr:hypothetical protein LPJ72_005858 [Coemansia sp. Benny D160-2]